MRWNVREGKCRDDSSAALKETLKAPATLFCYRLIHNPITAHKTARQKQLTAFRLSVKAVRERCSARADFFQSRMPMQRKTIAQIARIISNQMNILFVLQNDAFRDGHPERAGSVSGHLHPCQIQHRPSFHGSLLPH